MEYIPISRERARVRLASKVDMKLNFLPQFIVNMSARKFAFDYFKNIIKVNKKFEGSAWEKKINENPDFYHFFGKKINEYMADKEWNYDRAQHVCMYNYSKMENPYATHDDDRFD